MFPALVPGIPLEVDEAEEEKPPVLVNVAAVIAVAEIGTPNLTLC